MQVTTIGDGAMATVCSRILADNGCRVTMCVRLPEHCHDIQIHRENKTYLPGVKLPDSLQATTDTAAPFAACQLILCAVPTQYIRSTLTRLQPHIPPAIPIVSVAKGIEITTLLRPTQIIQDVLGPRPLAALSGPNIAGEIAKKLPATAVAATGDESLGAKVQELLTTPYFRIYRNTDLLGVELAGAMKNVIAVAAGILDGLGVGNNAKAALLTRGLVEMTRLGVALGAQAETFSGLAGLGDLVTTCVSPEGRNRTFGERIGKGEKPQDVLSQMVGVVEGIATTQAVVELARKHAVEMPISEGLYKVLFQGMQPMAGIAELMAREPKHEGGQAQQISRQ